MEFSEIWGFMKILSETIKIYLKNVKLMASITTLSLLLSSILFMLFNFAYQSATAYIYNSITDESGGILIIIILLLALVFAVEITFLFAYIAIANATGFATVITTAASYTDTKLSLQDLFSAVKTKRKTPIRYDLCRRGSPLYFLCIVAVVAAVYLVMFYPNPATITVVSVCGVAIFVYSLYASVVPAVAYVISVVEDAGCEAVALEKAEKLVERQRAHGFMVNLFINIVILIVCVGLWMAVGDRGRFNITVYGFFFVNCSLLWRIFLGVVYTVYYFRCKEYHAQQIQPLPFGEDSISTKLMMRDDIP